MFGTIRKHKTWLWIIISAGTVVSFVIFFSPDAQWDAPGVTGSDVYVSPTSGKTVNLFGQPISRKEFERAYRETMLFYFIRSGEWPDNDESTKNRIEADTLYRLLLVKRAEDLEIHVSAEAVAKTTLRRIGNYPYPKFVQEVLQPAGLSSADFERFAKHEAMIQQLAVVATTGAKLIMPQEADALYRQDNREVAAEVAVFWTTNFMDQVTVTPEALRTYFTNRQAAYRILPRVQLNYVEFLATNYLAEADQQLEQRTNLTAIIEEEYFRRGTNAFTDTNGVALPEAEAKAKLKEDIRRQFGLIEARKKANEFGTILYELADPNRVENLSRVAAEKNLEVKTTPPFNDTQDLEQTGFPSDFRETAMKLTPSKPIHFLPIVGEESVFVVALQTNLPSENPSFDNVQEKVRLDYIQDEARKLATAAGTNFYPVLTNGLAAGKSWSDLCREHKVSVVKLPPISPNTRSLTNVDERINLRYVQQVAFDLDKGEVSPFLRTPAGGMIIYLDRRLPIDEQKLKEELPDFMVTMRNARFSDAFNSWLRKQVELA